MGFLAIALLERKQLVTEVDAGSSEMLVNISYYMA
jgi:hypothetical protein